MADTSNVDPKSSEMMLLSGTANRPLAEAIAGRLGTRLCDVTLRRFADGEIFVRIDENVRGRDVFIIQPTHPPAENLVELLLLIDAASRASAARVTAVVPYYGYARQDRKDQPRVAIGAKLMANLIAKAGADRVVSIDFHQHQLQAFFDIPVDHLYAAPVIFDYLKRQQIDNLAVVSPDLGGLKMAAAYSQTLGAELAIVAKRRRSPTETEAISVIGDIEGRNVLLVDDLTETAGTLTGAAALIRMRGARRIFACVSHALLNELGIERLRNSEIDELITTDSVLRPAIEGVRITTLSVAGLLGEAIKRIHSNSSVTSLFEFKG